MGPRPPKLEKGKRPLISTNASSNSPQGYIGNGTIPAVDYMDLSKPPPLPVRPPPTAAAVSLTPATSLELKEPAPASSSPRKLSPSPVPAAASSPGTPLMKESSRGSSPERRKIMLTTLRQKKDPKKSKYKSSSSSRGGTRPAASKAAGLAWGTAKKTVPLAAESSDSDLRKETESRQRLPSEDVSRKIGQQKSAGSPFSSDYIPSSSWREPAYPDQASSPGFVSPQIDSAAAAASKSLTADASSKPPPTAPKPSIKSLPPPKYPAYRKEYLSNPIPVPRERNTRTPPLNRSTSATQTPTASSAGETSEQPARRTFPKSQSTPRALSSTGANRASVSSISGDEPARPQPRRSDASFDGAAASAGRKPKPPAPRRKPRITPPSSDQDSAGEDSSSELDEDPKLRDIMKKLPRGIDVNAARQILNDIVVRGDEVHWDDVAGLETAKKALKEAVVYPFLRPDLFMGLREPARGMLLFGPPGTGKTMLARAVATESKSTFFSVSASTLTSKWHGESEKLVRALFGLAKALAPSIIFVDEIDSLLSTRSSGTEHEASRRSKTEFLIQWSDLQRAAAGRNQSTDKSHDGGGDPSRVLVLAATNLPWDIDEAARRRFVRRQYIPLPEDHVREQQIRRLLSHQTHEMSNEDIEVLVKVTEGTSLLPPYL
jgi:fidgetin-like protein 1